MENENILKWTEMAKDIAMCVNSLPKNNIIDSPFLRRSLIECGCKYITPISTYVNKKYSSGTKKNGLIVRLKLPSEPIHYSEFLNVIIDYNKSNKSSYSKTDAHLLNIRDRHEKKPAQPITTAGSVLSTISDERLVNELRVRGFVVTAKKVIEL